MTGLPRLVTRARAGLLIRLAATGLAFAAIATAAALAARALAQQAGPDRPAGIGAALILVAAALALPFVRAAEQGLAERLALLHVAAIRDRILQHSFALPPHLMAGRRRHLVMLRFVGDMNAVRGWIRFGVARLIVLAVALPVLILSLWALNPPMAVLVGAPAVLVAAALLLLAPALRRRHAEMRRARARLAAEAGEALAAAATVAAAGRAASVRQRLRRRGEALGDTGAARARLSFAVRSLPEAMILMSLAALGLVTAQGFGAGLVAGGPGGLLGAVVGLGLLSPLLSDLARALDRRCDAVVAYAAIRRFLALSPVPAPGGATLADDSGPLAVVLESVRLTPGGPPIDATIGPGEVAAVVGPAGSGKSLLLACLAGLDRPKEGVIRVGGVDPRALPPRQRRDAIALASPEVAPLSGSVRRVLRWRAPEASDAEIGAVIEAVGLTEAIARAGGLEARLGPRGWMPSQGEQGLIVLAAALLGAPRLLLLDCPERLLGRAGLGRLSAVLARPGMTVIIATDDEGLLARCDRILTLAAPENIVAG
jgi:ABC-type multidrug transport system fused ATPase/permease subunit